MKVFPTVFALLFAVSCGGSSTNQSPENIPEPPPPVLVKVADDDTSALQVANGVVYVRDPKTAETTKPICFGMVRSLERTTHGAVNSLVSITYIPCVDISPELLIVK